MGIGIEKIGFYTPNKVLYLEDLAQARHVDPNKFRVGIGQDEMSVSDGSQDCVSMAINATLDYLSDADRAKVGLLILGTESGVDQSKSASLFVKSALKLPNNLRTFEVKEACFGLTAGVAIAHDYIQTHPEKTAIVIGSDLARYGLKTPGEPTQGAGSISLMISNHPRLIQFEPGHASYSEDIDDFWRPDDQLFPLVSGKYSTESYLKFFKKTFQAYKDSCGLNTSDFKAICYHLPFTKMGFKANEIACDHQPAAIQERLRTNFTLSAKYTRRVGNIYTGSLWLSFLSLVKNGTFELDDRIGFFSYGSGAVAEFFSAKV